MKIVMVGQNYRITGGSDRVLFDQMHLLNEMGHEVAPFCASHQDNLETPWSDYFPAGANFDAPSITDVANYVYSKAAKKNISRLLQEFNPDIVHCHIYYGKLTASILPEIKAKGVPLVQTLHEYKLVCPVYTMQSSGQDCQKCAGFKFYNAVTNRCNRGSLVRSLLSCAESYTSLALGSVGAFDHFFAVSDYLRNKVIEMGVPANKVTTLYNFTDANNVEPLYLPGDYFLYFGRLEKNKGIWPLLESFRICTGYSLKIVGTGSELVAMQNYVKQHNMTNVEFLGFLTGGVLSSAIRHSRCVIVPSMWGETFGLTVTEAFAHGKPVIASRIGAIPEVATMGLDSILIEPGSIDELVSAIEYIGTNSNLVKQMGEAARQTVLQRFSRERHYDELLGLYQRVKS